MYVRWQTHSSNIRRKIRKTRLSAILVGNVRVQGKPTQRHITYLGSLNEVWINRKKDEVGDNARCQFWEGVTHKLNELGKRVSPDDRESIETAIAKRVPCPTRQYYESWKKWRCG